MYCEMYDWPGNVRELQNFIERAVAKTEGPVFRPPLAEMARMAPGVSPAGTKIYIN